MSWLSPALAWVGAHPHWAGALLALVAFAESLAVVGLVVPGAIIMFAAGALAAGGGLSLWHLCLWAAAGAIAGDGVSFWLGRRYGDRLAAVWPLRRYPGALDRGIDFFRAHGGKSVLVGRFVGPVRPLIPAVAGMMHMPAARFFTINILSAFVWAPVYLLPGMVFAASLGVAAAVAGRLVTLIVLALALGWGAYRVARRVLAALRRLGQELAGHGPLGLKAAGVLLHGAGVGWLLGVAGVLALYAVRLLLPGALAWEHVVLELAGAHRTETGRLVAWVVTQCGSLTATVTCALAVAAALVLGGARRSARALVAAVALAIAATYLSKWLYGAARPVFAATHGFGYAFPSGHTAAAAVIAFAMAALVGARGTGGRLVAFSVAACFTALVALSRVYLGVHWPVDVLAGAALGVTAVGLLALWRREGLSPVMRRRISWLAPLALAVGATGHAWLAGADSLSRYPPAWSLPSISPQAACDRSADGPATLWLGDGTQLDRVLSASWQPAADWDLAGAMRWLSPQPYPLATPVLPRLHDGRFPERIYVTRAQTHGRRVLRAWRVARVAGGDLWHITAERERMVPDWPVLSITAAPDAPPAALRQTGAICH